MKVVCLWLFCLILLLNINNINSTLSQTIYTSQLTSYNVEPELPFYLDINEHFGMAVCFYDRNDHVLDCSLEIELVDPKSAAIFHGPVGQTGVKIYDFLFEAPLPDYMRQKFRLQDFNNYPIFIQEQDFLNGDWYIEVYSQQVEKIIRGQLQQTDDLYALMNTEETFPPSFGGPSRGIVIANVLYSQDPIEVEFDIMHNVINAVRIEVGTGNVGVPGEQSFFFTSIASPLFDSTKYTVNEEEQLLEGLQYIQIISESNRAGEIRGQIYQVDPVPDISFTGRMDGEQTNVKTNSRGCILVSYDCDTNIMEYLIFHNLEQTLNGFARIAPPGSTGEIAFQLAGTNSPIYGKEELSNTIEFLLLSQHMYFEIGTPAFPSGEIRGQISAQWDYFAHITGPQLVPPVTTKSLGCATFTLNGRILDYEIMHNIPLATETSLNKGAIDKSGTKEIVFKSPQEFITGTDEIILDDDELEQFYRGKTYIQINSEDFPFGEIRGQIHRINPCNSNPIIINTTPDGNPLLFNITRGASSTIYPNIFIMLCLSIFVVTFF
eukprot:TRINITY_DN452_c1_g1_i1.p1 TRINITY_DN452_c1_g1~~TRINITY_DN452_c1_g1_i1.p1  ORF type:complete len:556 (-),score=197.91 TRINITY_DN452_c1_g1_i1:96-1739(-)